MNYFNFLSIKQPKEIGYKVSRERDYSTTIGICNWITFYQTYGDGNCQHSADVPVGKELLEDFLGSLLVTLAEAPDSDRHEMLAVLAGNWYTVPMSRRRIEFALSIKYVEGKPTWYNLNELKVSRSPNRANDRRWEKVLPNMDGSVSSACAILQIGHDDLLRTLTRRLEIEAVAQDLDMVFPTCWEDYGFEKGRHGWIGNVWQSVANLVRGHRDSVNALDLGRRWADCAVPQTAQQS